MGCKSKGAFSLRSKRFRGKFDVLAARNLGREQKKERGGVGEERRKLTYFTLLISPSIDFLTNEWSDPRFRILRAQGLQTRLEYLSHLTTSSPTFWQICAKTCPLQSFLCDGLNKFSVEI